MLTMTQLSFRFLIYTSFYFGNNCNFFFFILSFQNQIRSTIKRHELAYIMHSENGSFFSIFHFNSLYNFFLKYLVQSNAGVSVFPYSFIVLSPAFFLHLFLSSVTVIFFTYLLFIFVVVVYFIFLSHISF